MEQGFRHIRCQVAVPGRLDLRRRTAALDSEPSRTVRAPAIRHRSRGIPAAYCPDRARSCSSTCAPRSATRSSCCTTSTSASPPIHGDQLAKELEQYQPLLPRGSLRAGGQRLLPAPAPADADPDRDGRALRQLRRVRAADPGPPDRLHPRPHLGHRRAHPGPQAGRALRVLRRAHRLARPGRRLAGRPRRQPRSSTSPAPTSASRRRTSSPSARARSSPAARRSATA